MPRIKIPLTLEVEFADAAEAAKYIDSTTGEVCLDYLADLWYDDCMESCLYPNTTLLTINGQTAEQVHTALAVRVP